MIEKSIFPTQLKLAEVKPIFKKGSKLDMTNYRPVSILPTISKIYERCMYRQMSSYFEHILSKYQCGFRKDFSTQHALIAMIEKWRQSLDEKKVCGALLTDLSKAFDCLPYDLLIAKLLHAYGFDKSSLELVHSYLSDRKQRVRIENTFSSWFEISHGVPQGSILGPLLFNIYIYICDIFMFIGNIDMMSYADDNTPFLVGRESEIVISELSTITKTIFNWFENNGMKANPDKCHLIVTENGNFQIEHDNFLIENSVCEKILGVKVDNKLTFKNHVETLCKKASQKLALFQEYHPI